MNVDKTHLATILKFSDSKDLFDTLDPKYSTSNASRLHQLFHNCQAVSTQKSLGVIEKYKSILNFNAKIRIQKPKLVFGDKHLTNFFLASMPSTCEGIIDNLNIHNILTFEKTFYIFCIKEMEFTD